LLQLTAAAVLISPHLPHIPAFGSLISTVHGHPRSLTLVPIESAYVTSY